MRWVVASGVVPAGLLALAVACDGRSAERTSSHVSAGVAVQGDDAEERAERTPRTRDDARGMTLFPDPVEPGERLRFVVDGSGRASPDTAAPAGRAYQRGDTVHAHADLARGGVRWILLRDTSYALAAHLDRLPGVVTGTLTAGSEELARGRVLPWGYVPDDLDTVPARFKADGYAGRPIYLRRGTLEAFGRMIEAAAADGVVLRVFSGWRSAEYQAQLYARNLARRGPMQTISAAPGRSEHQLGTAADFTTPGVPLLTPSFATSGAGRWVERRAAEFGVVATFSADRHRRRGVSFEPWHLRWVGEHVEDDSGW